MQTPSIPTPEIVVIVFSLLKIGWYLCVPWMLWLIWRKVRHLPG